MKNQNTIIRPLPYINKPLTFTDIRTHWYGIVESTDDFRDIVGDFRLGHLGSVQIAQILTLPLELLKTIYLSIYEGRLFVS
jgi:hypothetical protein